MRISTPLYLFAAVFLTILGSDSAPAQQTIGIAPAFVEASVKAGSSYTQTFKVSNSTTTPMVVRVSLLDYWYGANNETVTAPAGTLARSASPWVQLIPAEVAVAPGATAELKALITVPATARGGYYTMPAFDARPSSSASAPTAKLAAQIGIRFNGLLMLTVQGATDYDVKVVSGKVEPPSADSELEIALGFKNAGNCHVRVRGLYAILDAQGKLVGRGRLDEKRIMPDQQVVTATRWAGELAPGHYTAVLTLSYDRAGMAPESIVYDLPFQTGARATDAAGGAR